MKTYRFTPLLLTALLLLWPFALAAQSDSSDAEAVQAAREARRAELEALIEEAELKRKLAMEEAAEAQELVRQRENQVHREAEQRRQELNAEQAKLEKLQSEEFIRLREELSRTHQELREVSREVAQAHRELAMANRSTTAIRHINLGDRAVIGVILGAESDEGVEIIGVSPDGPAEQAGIQAGDLMVAIGGSDLTNLEPQSPRRVIYDVMDEVTDGEEVTITVLRDQELVDLTVTAECREPTSWQSLIRIPQPPDAPAGVAPTVRIKEIVLPEIDKEALDAEIAELQAQVENMEHVFIDSDEFAELMDGDWEFEFSDMSQFGQEALRQANVWFGLPQAQGLELASINPELGNYFDTDRGVLVIRAKPGNAYALQSGDVVLDVDSKSVDTPSDMMRALRELESGEEVALLIKRDRRDVTLNVIVPDNRLSFSRMHAEKHP